MSILSNLIFVLSVLVAPLLSVSAPPFPFEVQQPNGNKIPVRMFGHEYYNWMETEDGYVIDWVEDDVRLGWYYSKLNSDGRFYPSHILVQYPAPNYLDIPKNLREISPRVRKFEHNMLHSNSIHNTYLDRSASSSLIKPLVFLVDFNSLPAGMPERIYNKNQFQNLFFKTNLDSDDADLPASYDMSVQDYYTEISNENLLISGDENSIVDWTTVDHNYSYYVDGVQGTGQGNGPDGTNNIFRSAAALVVEIAMEHHSDIDFTQFDGNGDGDVDVVILIVEGWGNGADNQFWPHMSRIPPGDHGIGAIDPSAPTNDDGYFSIDGVAIKNYIVIPEQFHMNNYGALENYIHPIGTICHELGHVLGLPDLYDTSDQSAAGIGKWGLMGSGNYQIETSPAYMSAWSRYQLGFIDPLIIDNVINAEKIILPAEIGSVDMTAMILPMDSNLPQEYLILENRQQMGSDQYLEKSGLLVWHIDETITAMYPAINSVNVNEMFYGVNLIQADGLGQLYTNTGNAADANDPFPGNMKITTLTHLSTYSYDRDADGSIESGSDSGIEIKNIIEDSDSLITLTVINPNKLGQVIGYDEGGYNGISYNNSYDFLKWAGIRITALDTALLSGIQTVFPPSYWVDGSNIPWNVTDYTVNIWKGWSNNKPEQLLYRFDGNVQWQPAIFRDGGWAHISLIEQGITWDMGENYYVEIDYNGTGGLYPIDKGVFSNSISDNMSYFRGNLQEQCNPLTAITDDGDWNIRAVMSGLDDFESLSIEDIPQTPQKHRIYSNYPNPFNPISTLPIYLVAPSHVSYFVFDIQGRQITERDFPLLNIGYHEFDVNMNHLSSGVYFYQFVINEMDYTPRKMVLLK